MAKVICEICGEEVDKRGLKNHMRKHEREANEQKESVEEKEEITEEPEDLKESPEDEKDPKNLKRLISTIAAGILGLIMGPLGLVMGVTVLMYLWILNPLQSKKANTSQKQTRPQTSRRH